METHHYKPKGVWATVKGMSSWCNLNCVRCNIACTGNGNCKESSPAKITSVKQTSPKK